MLRYRLAAAAFGFAAAIAMFAVVDQAKAAEVKLEADLGQSVLPASKTSRVYLRLNLKTLAAAERRKRAPVNVALVLDRSGSMAGERIVAAKKAAEIALARLGRDDTVAIVAYNHEVDLLSPSQPLTDKDALNRKIDALKADGRTALHAGVVAGSREVKKNVAETKVNRVILLSDGLANVGPSTPKELAELGRELGSKGISVSTIGLGLEYNEDLMQRLAGASDGNHAFARKPSDLARIFDSEFGDALSIAAQDIEITIECKLGFKPIRILGREAEIKGERIALKLNQLQADNERYVVVELEAPANAGGSAADIAEVHIDYLDIDTGKRSRGEARVQARFSDKAEEVEQSVNKPVMVRVTEQVATETNEKAVELRDKGDVAAARKLLEENALYLRRSKEKLTSGAGAAPPAAAKALGELETKNLDAAGNLDPDKWATTRKSMRSDQHKSKVQQTY